MWRCHLYMHNHYQVWLPFTFFEQPGSPPDWIIFHLYWLLALCIQEHFHHTLIVVHFSFSLEKWAKISVRSEEVRHGDITTEVKCVWNVTTVAFCSLRGILLSLFFVACTGAGPCAALEVQSSNSNSRGQIHSQSEGPTRGHGVWLTCQSVHFHSSKYQNDSSL